MYDEFKDYKYAGTGTVTRSALIQKLLICPIEKNNSIALGLRCK